MHDALKRAVRAYADLHANVDGLAVTPILGFTLMRHYGPTEIAHLIYRPLLCLVLQGTKEVMAGDQVMRFGAGQSLLVNVDLPAIGRIIRASPAEPYLAVALELDMAVMRSLMEEMAAQPAAPPRAAAPIFVEETEAVMLDCAKRLVRLLDHPEAAPVLRQGLIREMHYWLLAGAHGGILRRLAPADSHAQRIARAIARLRQDFARPLRVETLSEIAGMSASAFHLHFKSVTSISPLQFQKQLRLLEARRLMLAEGEGPSQAGFAVGYESVQQFTREYGRMFGNPPKRDVTESRAAA
jgi:AraC-like DNA-binding protein